MDTELTAVTLGRNTPGASPTIGASLKGVRDACPTHSGMPSTIDDRVAVVESCPTSHLSPEATEQ